MTANGQLTCRGCGDPLPYGKAVWFDASNRRAKTPACQQCYEREIRNAGRERVNDDAVLVPCIELNWQRFALRKRRVKT